MDPAADPSPPARVALVHPGALGDVVQALPAFGAIRTAFPSAELVLVTGDDLAPLVERLGLFDRVVAFDARAAYRGGLRARAAAFLSVARALRAVAPDRVGVFKAAPVWSVLAAASGAPIRAGLARSRAAGLLTVPIPIDARTHHETRYAEVARALGADPGSTAPVDWGDALPEELAALLGAGGEAAAPLVALVPGGARNAKQDTDRKRWPADRWAAVAAALVAERPGLRIVLLGAPGDRAEADRVRGALPAGAVVDLVGRTSIPEAREALARCTLVLCSDSGLLHVAGTTATPVVAVFGPTDPRLLAPTRPGVTVVWHPTDGTPCQDGVTGGIAERCVAPCCLERVTVADVLAAARPILAATAAPHRAGVAAE